MTKFDVRFDAAAAGESRYAPVCTTHYDHGAHYGHGVFVHDDAGTGSAICAGCAIAAVAAGLALVGELDPAPGARRTCDLLTAAQDRSAATALVRLRVLLAGPHGDDARELLRSVLLTPATVPAAEDVVPDAPAVRPQTIRSVPASRFRRGARN
jgi:hypothetical protein